MRAAWFGLCIGILLLVAKYCGFWLLTSVKDKETGQLKQRILPKWIIFGKPMPLRDRINDSTFLLFCIDTLFGYLGINILAAMGGGVIATVAIVAYTITCMAMLMKQFLFNWIDRKFSFKRKAKSGYDWQANHE